jgi:hypothetical protein
MIILEKLKNSERLKKLKREKEYNNNINLLKIFI